MGLKHEVLLASAARTTTTTTADQYNYDGARAIEIVVDLTAFTTAASLTVSLQEYDPAKGGYITVLSTAAITAVGTAILTYAPSASTAANRSAVGFLADRWRVVATHGNANSHTYSISAKIITD